MENMLQGCNKNFVNTLVRILFQTANEVDFQRLFKGTLGTLTPPV